PDNLTTSCKRCLRSLIIPNLGISTLNSKPLSWAVDGIFLAISDKTEISVYGFNSWVTKSIFFLLIECFYILKKEHKDNTNFPLYYKKTTKNCVSAKPAE